jgi:hypothetical protein
MTHVEGSGTEAVKKFPDAEVKETPGGRGANENVAVSPKSARPFCACASSCLKIGIEAEAPVKEKDPAKISSIVPGVGKVLTTVP